MGRMRKILRFLLPAGVVVLAVVVVMAMAGIAKNKRPEQKQEEDQKLLVDVLTADRNFLNFVVESQGSVRPRTETTVVAEVSGKISSVSPNFVAGGFFRKGDVLLQIDPSDYSAALKRAQAALASRRAQLLQELARSDQALKDWNNLGGNRGEPNDLVLRKPQLAEAKANVRAAEADVEKAMRDLERTKIRVPYDGLVKEKSADIGQFVSPGTRLGITFAVDSAEIRLPLSGNDLAFLELPAPTGDDDRPAPKVILSATSGGTERQWEATIIRTEGVVDESSRVVYAVAQVRDPYGVFGISRAEPLKIGTFVSAEIEGIPADNLVILPRSVLRSDNTVLVANSENQLEVRPVAIERSTPQTVYIREGIEPGERVIVTALEAPIPGTQLAIAGDEEEDSDAEDAEPSKLNEVADSVLAAGEAG